MQIKKFFISFVVMSLITITACGHSKETPKVSDVLPEFTQEEPADYPIMNAMVDHPVLGDERDFVRIGELRDDGMPLTLDDFREYRTEEMKFEAGKSYIMLVYFHNAADPELGVDAAVRELGFNIAVPDRIRAKEPAEFTAQIPYNNGEPVIISSTIWVSADEDLAVINDTGYLYNREIDTLLTSCTDDLLLWDSPACGVTIDSGRKVFSGILPDQLPGYEYAGYLVLKFDAVAAK